MVFVRAILLLILLVSTVKADQEHEAGCLALNIYHEARGESIVGRLAVASVTYNRVKSPYFDNTFCSVVWDKGQFEWTEDGKSDQPKNWKLYGEILRFSKTFLEIKEYVTDPTNGALFYHANYVKPCWLPDAKLLITIGKHLFYDVNHKGTSCWDLLQERRNANT